MESEASKSSMGLYALIAAGIAIVIAIVAIVLIFVIPGPAGPAGSDGKHGSSGNASTSGMAITGSQTAIVYSGSSYLVKGYDYTIPSVYNYANIVIPQIPTDGTGVYFTINATSVKIGDVFTIDNSNNSGKLFRVSYIGFDNHQSPDKSDQVSINDGMGMLNTVLIQVTAGKTTTSKNLLMIASPA